MHRRTWLKLTAAALAGGAAAASESSDTEPSLRLPASVMPDLGCWFWIGTEAFRPRAYRRFLDTAAAHSSYGLLTTSLRAPNAEITRPEVHERLKQATEYAQELGLGIVLDLDVRLARRAFQERYPQELQEMLRLREVALDASEPAELRIGSETLNDHYTGGGAEAYVPLSGRLVRAYSYSRTPEGIDPTSVEDVTDGCEALEASAQAVNVRLPAGKGRAACVMAAFTHLTPDVFAPHLPAFQKWLLEQYADVPLAGVCKDEWGFPPCFDANPAHNDFWYSEARRRDYAKTTGGRDLLRDCLLMWAGEVGREGERRGVINQFLEQSRRRNAQVERRFYRATKDVFGPESVPATHPTWFPYPGVEEFKKNGLHWWQAPRDWAQVDEVTPYCVRTSLCKKWESPVWYNMYYSAQKGNYERGIWSHALGGGRMNCHPLYPLPGGSDHYDLMRGGLMRGISRIRLLSFISDSPLGCPVAVVFGHPCAMNWAGPHYGDSGVDLADGFWRRGFPADLIPSSEVHNGSLRVGEDGSVRYGPQRYAALVLYHPQFEGPKTATFMRRAVRGRKTHLQAVGEWTRDFLGNPFDGEAALGAMVRPSSDDTLDLAVAHLEESGIQPVTPASATISGFRREIASPPAAGMCRLIDGTEIMVAGEQNPEGDPIQGEIALAGRTMQVDAVGLVAARFNDAGALEALAVAGLRSIRFSEFSLTLPTRADIALWQDNRGQWHGAVQDLDGPLPLSLLSLTPHWLRLGSPPPLP